MPRIIYYNPTSMFIILTFICVILEPAITTVQQQQHQQQQHQHQHQQQQQPPQQQSHQQRVIQNSFDIINPLVIDEGGEQKRKQPPLVFRSGTREVHNKLEKHRRAHLKGE